MPWTTLCIDDARRLGPVNEPARRESLPLDVRVGSSTNALRPILAAERSLGAGLRQWVGLGAVASPRSRPTS